jgi:hypothetical protein
MAIRFTPCPACARHVKEGDGACPFCGASVPPPAAAVVPGRRMSRAALLAASAAGALAMTDCSSSGTPVYGGPVIPEDGSSVEDAPGSRDANATDTGSAQPLYGAMPVPDAGETTDATPDAAAPADASGVTGDGGHMVQPLYGAIAPPYGTPPH